MKKFLSLVLALVMTMSLVTVSAGAEDFTDAADINYEEAVEVMTAVGVVSGYANGSFNPEGGLTRQAAAKIICNMILGPTTAAELDADTAPYPDVAVDSDFAGYIAYCQKEGIISGYADGTFKPANPLTGYAFMKMLLGALGYDGETEGYTGANWSINVAKKAIGIGLNAGLKTDFNGSDFVSREEACLYAFNTLKATMVEYDQQSTIVVGDATVTLAGTAQDLAWGTGTLNDGKVDKDGFVQFAEKYFSKLTRTDDISVFGQPANTWTYNKKDVGTYVDYTKLAAEWTVEVEGGDVYAAIGSVAADYDLTYWVDGEELDKDATKAQAEQIAKKNDEVMANSGNGVLTQVFVDNDAEELTIVEINTYLAKTDDYNEKKETLKLDEVWGYGYGEYDANDVETLALEDFAVIADYVEGDMVLVTVAKGVVQSIVDAELVESVEIDEFSKKDYVKADGTQYDYAETATWNPAVLVDYDKSNLNDTTFDLYLDTYGYMIGIEEVEADDEYVFITAYDRPTSHLTNKTAEAKAIFTDGTEAVIEVNVTKSTFKPDAKDAETSNNWIAEGGDEIENTWYAYTKKGDIYTLKYVTNQFVNNEDSNPEVTQIDSKHISQYDGKDYFYGNADTNYIVVGVDKVNKLAVIDEVESITTGVKNVSIDVYSAEDVMKVAKTDNAASQGVYTLTKTSGAYIIASIVIGDDGTVSDRYAYLYGEPERERYNKTEDVYYWDMAAVIDGEETTVTFKSELAYDDNFDEDLYKLSYDKDGYAVDAVPAEHETDYDWVDEFDPDDTKLIKTSFGTKNQPAVDLTAKGYTLWITMQNIERGFALADECPAVIIEQDTDGYAEKVVEYTSVEKAIKALDNYDNDAGKANFDGTIIMVVKDGIVTSVILTDTVEKTTDKNEVNGVTALLKVSEDGKGLALQVTGTEADDEVSFKVVAKDIRSGNEGVVNSGVITEEWTKVLAETDSTMTYSVELTINKDTIKVTL